METRRKYKVGDRVVYRAVESGNTDLDGRVGTVVGIDGTAAPYTVRFDEPYVDAVRDERFGGSAVERWHDWWCKEENLSSIGVRIPVKKNEKNESKEGKEYGMAKGQKKHEWTDAEDRLIREMLEAGESVVNICDRIGVDYVDMKNHLHKLRREDPTFPRCMKRGRAGVINEEFDRAFEEDGGQSTTEINGQSLSEAKGCSRGKQHINDTEAGSPRVTPHPSAARRLPPSPTGEGLETGEHKGELNELEAAMAEQIKDLTREVEALGRENAEMEKENGLLHEDLVAYEAKIKELETEAAVSEDRVQSQIDHIAKLVAEKRKAEAELERTRRIVTELCAQYVI